MYHSDMKHIAYIHMHTHTHTHTHTPLVIWVVVKIVDKCCKKIRFRQMEQSIKDLNTTIKRLENNGKKLPVIMYRPNMSVDNQITYIYSYTQLDVTHLMHRYDKQCTHTHILEHIY